jgi:hypothetical protein
VRVRVRVRVCARGHVIFQVDVELSLVFSRTNMN